MRGIFHLPLPVIAFFLQAILFLRLASRGVPVGLSATVGGVCAALACFLWKAAQEQRAQNTSWSHALNPRTWPKRYRQEWLLSLVTLVITGGILCIAAWKTGRL